jgi:PBSX family phage terminase large subunit
MMGGARRTIWVTDLIGSAFMPVHADIARRGHRHYQLAGGRGSGKSTFASIEVALGLLANPNADGIIFRKVGATLGSSVVPQMRWAFDALALGDSWAYRPTAGAFVNTYTGQRLLLRGVDDPVKSKGLKSERDGFEYIWFEEFAEFQGMEEIRVVLQSVMRSGEGEPVCIYTYNPPSDPNHWANVSARAERADTLVHRSDYTMMPAAWLGEAFIEEAEALRELDERAWRHAYMGEAVGVDGSVFANIECREITKEERARFDRFVNGLDFGYASDPDVCVRAAVERSARRLYIVDEFWGIGTRAGALAERVMEICGREPVTCDSADPRLIDELRMRGVMARPARKGAGSVMHGIRWLAERAAIIIDPIRCPHSAREFLGYAYQRDGYGSYTQEPPDRDNHTIDALRYACEPISTLRLARTWKRDS